MTEEIYFPKDLRGTEVIMFITKRAIAFLLVFIYVWLSLGLNCGIWGLSLVMHGLLLSCCSSESRARGLSSCGCKRCPKGMCDLGSLTRDQTPSLHCMADPQPLDHQHSLAISLSNSKDKMFYRYCRKDKKGKNPLR